METIATETDHFVAASVQGVTYRIVERTHVSKTVLDECSWRCTPTHITYSTVTGQPVTRCNEGVFAIAASGILLTRLGPPRFSEPTDSPPGH